MRHHNEEILSRYRRDGVLLDANLLILFVVGMTDEAFIVRHKNTQGFKSSDFATLQLLLSRFDRFVTTPHVLTEASNLLAQTKKPMREECLEQFASIVQNLEEVQLAGRELVGESGFLHYGLTDVALARAARDRILLVTNDSRLSTFLYQQGVEHLPFAALRDSS